MIHHRDDGQTVQLELISVISKSSKRVETERETLRAELRKYYQDREELIDILVRQVRKAGRRMSVEDIEDWVIDLAHGFIKDRAKRAREEIARLMGG